MKDKRTPLPWRPSRDEIDEEILHHMRGRIDDLVRAGRSREDAEREVRQRFGNPGSVRKQTERVYAPERGSFFGTLVSEIVGAARSLRHRPAFALTAILLVAVGIGATTVMLAVVDAYLLRGMPFPHAERLAWINETPPQNERVRSRPAEVNWREADDVGLAVSWDRDAFTLLGDGPPQTVSGVWVPPDFFEAFGITTAMGRSFAPDEIGPNAAPVAIISHDLWQTRFGGAEDVLGHTIRMYASDRPDDAQALTVIGVLAADWWHMYESTQILTPLGSHDHPTYVVRIETGVEMHEAAQRMTAFARQSWGPEFSDWNVELSPMHEQHVEEVRPLLQTLGAGVSLVLLIACANVAVLFLVQAVGRTREFALRAALGAARSRLALRLVAEAAVVGLAGAVVGALISSQVLAVLGSAIEVRLGASVPGGTTALALQPRVLLVSIGITGVVTLLFGLAPLLAGIGGNLSGTLTGSGRSSTGTARHRTLRTGLIVLEVALSVALLVGAGLTMRSAIHLSNVELGFQPEGLIRMGFGMSSVRYPSAAEWHQRIEETVTAFREVPGVESVAAANPGAFSFAANLVTAVDGPMAESDTRLRAAVRYIGVDYLETLDIQQLDGRDFATSDNVDNEPVALVSDEFAATMWPGEDPMGKEIRIADPMGDGSPTQRRVVGVVGDTRESLTGERELPDAYIPLAQAPFPYVFLTVRAQVAPETLMPTLEQIVWNDDPEQPLNRPGLLQRVIDDAAATPQALARLLTVFASFGALLAVVGVYGVIAFAARQRRRELAVRVALGAARNDVLQIVLGHGARVVAVGLALGLFGAWFMAQTLASQIYGVSPTDPITFGGVATMLGLVALGAVLIPARKAAATDPMSLLRED